MDLNVKQENQSIQGVWPEQLQKLPFCELGQVLGGAALGKFQKLGFISLILRVDAQGRGLCVWQSLG